MSKQASLTVAQELEEDKATSDDVFVRGGVWEDDVIGYRFPDGSSGGFVRQRISRQVTFCGFVANDKMEKS